MDISYTIKEKSVLYAEEIRASISSLKEVFDYVRRQASEEAFIETYKENIEVLQSQLKERNVIQSSIPTNKKYAFIPTYSISDKYFNQAKVVIMKYESLAEKLKSCRTYECSNEEIDKVLKEYKI